MSSCTQQVRSQWSLGMIMIDGASPKAKRSQQGFSVHRLQGHGPSSAGSGSQDAGEWTDTRNLKWLTDTQSLVTTHPLQTV